MEEVCERGNLKEALQQVKANKGSGGIDGMTVEELDDYLKQHWPGIRERIKIHVTRMIRLMEVLLHSGTKITGWRTAEVHQAILTSFGLKPTTYTLHQLRYDIRKRKTHGLIERCGKRYAYPLTDKGNKVALLFVLFHKRVCGPLAHSLFQREPSATTAPNTKLEAAYRKADHSIQQILQLLAA